MRNTEPEASLGMTSLGGAGGGQILTAVTDPVSCNVKTQREKEIEGREEVVVTLVLAIQTHWSPHRAADI